VVLFKMSKRGLSGVITTVLLILLVIIAIGIIWAFLGPFLSEGGSGLEGSTACLNLNVNPVNCVKGYDDSEALTEINVSAERGPDNEVLSELKIILHKSDGDTFVYTQTNNLTGPLEIRKYTLDSKTSGFTLEDYQGVSLGKIVQIGEGDEFICEQVSDVLDCQ